MTPWTLEQVVAHYRALGLSVPDGLEAEAPKPNKFNACKKLVDGILFDSGREAGAYIKLRALQVAGEIIDIQRQVKFELQSAFRKDGQRHRAIEYRADFVVTMADGTRRVFEPKGYRTKDYRIKRKLFEARYPHLRIEEI